MKHDDTAFRERNEKVEHQQLYSGEACDRYGLWGVLASVHMLTTAAVAAVGTARSPSPPFRLA